MPEELLEPDTVTTVPETTSPKPRRIQFLTWERLSNIGHIEFLKVSYAVLILVPFVALLQHELEGILPTGLRHMPWILRLAYFSSLSLSLAHMLYQGYCPPIIKRFGTPNDLYRAMLEIKALQRQYLPNDFAFSFHLQHCRDSFKAFNVRYWMARLACGVFYLIGILLFAAVIFLQAARLFGKYWLL